MDIVAVLTKVAKEQASLLSEHRTQLAKKDAAIKELRSELNTEIKLLQATMQTQSYRLLQLEQGLTATEQPQEILEISAKLKLPNQ